VRSIHIFYNAYQLSIPGDRTTAPDPLVWNTSAFGVSSSAEIIGVERDDGNQGLPSDPIRHRSTEDLPPPLPSASPQQNEISVLFLGDPDDFLNRFAHGYHRVDAGPISWRNQGVELPASFLAEVVANELLLKRRLEVASDRVEHVAEI
jgi:hypothetical protein